MEKTLIWCLASSHSLLPATEDDSPRELSSASPEKSFPASSNLRFLPQLLYFLLKVQLSSLSLVFECSVIPSLLAPTAAFSLKNGPKNQLYSELPFPHSLLKTHWKPPLNPDSLFLPFSSFSLSKIPQTSLSLLRFSPFPKTSLPIPPHSSKL